MGQAKPVRLALVGYGYWGPNLARNFHQLEDAELAYVIDANPAALAKAQRLYGCATAADIGVALADPNVDAIVLATPARTHFALGQQALLAGKHLFVEKPLTMDLAEGKELTRVGGQPRRDPHGGPRV